VAEAVIGYTARSPYLYNRSFYNQHICRMPSGIIGGLDRYRPDEEYMAGMWTGLSQYISGLLTLKDRIGQAFSS
jgi:hypothetical protein